MGSKKLGYLLVIGVVLLFFLGTVHAAEKVYTCRIATFMSSKDSAGMGCIKLGELLNAKGKGRIKASVSTNAELGNQRELCEMVRDGSVEVTTSLPSGTGRYVPALAVFELPYIYKDDAHMVRVLKALRSDVGELLAPHNIKPFGYMDIGFRHMLNKKRPIRKVADLKGLKMRGPNPMYIGMFNALGASGTTVTWTEVYTALQSGVVDGMEASPALIYAMKFQEQAKYLSKTFHIGANFYLMTGKKWFDSLPKDLQKVFIEATEEASKYAFDTEMELERQAMDKLIAEGVKVNEVDDLNEFRNKLIDFREKYVKDKGAEFEKLYKKMLGVK